MQDAKVMVVGCGALGNEVLKNLVLMGVGHLVLVDFDCVEHGNLTRSILFRRADAEAGRRKVYAASARLLELNPKLEVQTIHGDIAHDVGLGVIGDMDVVIGCVDSRWARFMLNRHCMRMGKPWVDGGIGMWEGTVRVFIPGKNCYACNLGTEGLDELRKRMPCSHVIRRMEQKGSVPTTSIMASIIGAVEVQETLKLIEGKETLCGKMFYYEGACHSTKVVDFRGFDHDCPEHEAWPMARMTDLSCQSTVGEVLDNIGDCMELRDDCFVDYLICRKTNLRYDMMVPGRKVVDTMERNEGLRGRLLGDFYQHEYRTIDVSFPYKDLTLAQLGIPDRDIIMVDCEPVALKAVI